MFSTEEKQIDHEVRIRLLEEIAKDNKSRFDKIDQRFDRMDEKIDRTFHWMLGIQIGTLLAIFSTFGGLLLTKVFS